jgi:hypothetical protein
MLNQLSVSRACHPCRALLHRPVRSAAKMAVTRNARMMNGLTPSNDTIRRRSSSNVCSAGPGFCMQGCGCVARFRIAAQGHFPCSHYRRDLELPLVTFGGMTVHHRPFRRSTRCRSVKHGGTPRGASTIAHIDCKAPGPGKLHIKMAAPCENM